MLKTQTRRNTQSIRGHKSRHPAPTDTVWGIGNATNPEAVAKKFTNSNKSRNRMIV
jgi:tRNA A37 threonylcarbamoyladenosine synthetase subunit TsaC/SUA5/YrdC